MTQCFYYPANLPVGTVYLMEIDGNLCAITADLLTDDLRRQFCRLFSDELQFIEHMTPILQLTQNQLDEYFSGTRKHFQLPIRLYGSEFQKAVWQQLQQIPYGETTTYGCIAAKLNQKGAQAVGTAVGKNPLPIIIPCHRVLPHSGKLGNFSMKGGPAIKAFLLDLEGADYRS